jgi:hypothetical protein
MTTPSTERHLQEMPKTPQNVGRIQRMHSKWHNSQPTPLTPRFSIDNCAGLEQSRQRTPYDACHSTTPPIPAALHVLVIGLSRVVLDVRMPVDDEGPREDQVNTCAGSLLVW